MHPISTACRKALEILQFRHALMFNNITVGHWLIKLGVPATAGLTVLATCVVLSTKMTPTQGPSIGPPSTHHPGDVPSPRDQGVRPSSIHSQQTG